MSTLVSKQEILMERVIFPDEDLDDLTIFADTDEERPQRNVSLHTVDWLAMGSPEVITVSIQPGDRLNGEA